MNAKRKTYGVSGYMEWVALIECGKATVKVHFSGGSLTGYGVTPAEFKGYKFTKVGLEVTLPPCSIVCISGK